MDTPRSPHLASGEAFRIVVIADDLTGAADACVAFVARGLSGAVLFDDAVPVAGPVADAVAGAATDAVTDAVTDGVVDVGADAGPQTVTADDPGRPYRVPQAADADADTDADVVTFSTDTRAETAEVAAGRVRACVQRCARAYAPDWTFKKIDSTLRGHTGVEILAARDAGGFRAAIIAPAFPAMGRTVDGGLLRVTGRGARPPVDVIARLALGGARRVARGRLSAALASGAHLLVCDAVDDGDLDAIVDAGIASGEPLLWAGSAGLAHALARRLAPDGRGRATGRIVSADPASPARHAGRANPADPAERAGHADHVERADHAERPERASHAALAAPADRGSILFAIGSNHPVTVAQQDALLRDHPQIVPADVSDADTIAHALSHGRDLLVSLPPAARDRDVTRFAATIEAPRARPIAGLVMSGGDTAARLCRHLRALRLDLDGEVCPGIPWGRLSARSGARWPVVLKAGGFGADEDLGHALVFLMENDERHI